MEDWSINNTQAMSTITITRNTRIVTIEVTRAAGPRGLPGEQGDSFDYGDFTEEQLAALKGEKGDQGDAFEYVDFTPEQLAALKGEKGDQGDAFDYSDFTPEQLATLKGEKGDQGDAFEYADFTPEQLAALKGDKGDQGEAFDYSDFTPEQLTALKGEKGDQGETGDNGRGAEEFYLYSGIKYGMLYSGNAILNSKSICTAKAHVPSLAEWQILIDLYGGNLEAGKHLKETGTEHWLQESSGNDNSSGFTALPGGYLVIDNTTFQNIGAIAAFGTSTLNIDEEFFGAIFLNSAINWVTVETQELKSRGFSVRLIIDEPDVDNDDGTGIYFGINGEKYPIIYIGTQWWLQVNLAETFYRDLTPIPEIDNFDDWADNTIGARCYYNWDEENMRTGVFTDDLWVKYSDGLLEFVGKVKGDKGEQGEKGDQGDAFEYIDFTPEQLAALKGEKGDQGDAFEYTDFTQEQLAALKGEKGDQGDAFEYVDFTPEQLAALKGEKGDQGDAFEYVDFTPEQLAALKGEKGDQGDKGDTGEKGDTGAPGGMGFASNYHFCEDILFAGTTPVWHELERQSDGGAVGSHTATTTSYTELDRYVTAALGTTIIPAGDWKFLLYAKVTAQSGQIKAEIYRVNSAGAIVGNVIGTAETTTFISTTVVGLMCSVYTAEQTGWATTDRIGIVMSGKKIGAPAATLTWYHDMPSGWGSAVETPLTLLHNQMNGLNEGDYKHLTAAQLITFGTLKALVQVGSLTLSSGSWSLVSGLYEYNLSNANILATSVVDVIPDNADIEVVQTAQIYPKTVSSAGSVKLYAKNAPAGNIGVTINIY